MPRPRFAPGDVVVFATKSRSGKKRLDSYLASRLAVVDAWAADLIAAGLVRLDGAVARPGDLINLSAGPHRLEVCFPEAWPRHMAATEMPLDILHEDASLVVLNKPAGIVTHPARGHLDNQTLQNGIRHRYRHGLGDADFSLAAPHRLDQDTSGVIVFAITRADYVDLVEQFSSRLPRKEYLAILDGQPDFEQISCQQAIGADPECQGRGKVLPVAAGGREAHTDFRILEKGNGWALALAAPRTGRPHQIRVHAAALGLPLAGDQVYNPNPERLGMPRQALHASTLIFRHPARWEWLRVVAPLAGDMKAALDRLRMREKK